MGNPKWKAGVSGNPAGRPKKGNSLTDILESLGKKKENYYGRDLERRQALAEMLWSKAIDDKDIMAAKYIFDRIDGTPIARNEISGPDGESLTAISIEFISASKDKD